MVVQRVGKRWVATLAVLLSAMLALVAPTVTQAAATSFTIVETIPFTTEFEGCGDVISIDGEIQHVFHITLTGTGKLVVTELFHPQGLTGVGLLSGATYHAVGETKSTATIGVGAVFTTTNNFKMISSGSTANYLVREISHLTFNARGELISSFDKFSLECRG